MGVTGGAGDERGFRFVVLDEILVHFLFLHTLLCRTWLFRMNEPHAKKLLIYTFILMPVKAQTVFSSRIYFSPFDTLLLK